MLEKVLVYYYFVLSTIYFLLFCKNVLMKPYNDIINVKLILTVLTSFICLVLIFYLPVLLELLISFIRKRIKQKCFKIFLYFTSGLFLQLSFCFYFALFPFIKTLWGVYVFKNINF